MISCLDDLQCRTCSSIVDNHVLRVAGGGVKGGRLTQHDQIGGGDRSRGSDIADGEGAIGITQDDRIRVGKCGCSRAYIRQRACGDQRCIDIREGCAIGDALREYSAVLQQISCEVDIADNMQFTHWNRGADAHITSHMIDLNVRWVCQHSAL